MSVKSSTKHRTSETLLPTIHQGARTMDQGHARQTLVMGPATDWVRCDPAELAPGLALGLNAVILCDTPSAKMNCSRSSMFVRPLAAIQHKEPRASRAGIGREKGQRYKGEMDCMSLRNHK